MSDLRYYLIEDGDSEWLENFQILDRRRQNWGSAEIVLYVLGTSHAVSICWRGKTITELLSCGGRLEMCPPFAELAAIRPFEVTTRIHGIHYRFRLTFEALAGNDDLTMEFPAENKISIAYPQVPGLATPVTKIGWKIGPGTLQIETLHTYPEEANGVRTDCLFEMAGNDR